MATDLHYQGALVPVNVVMIKFYNMANLILSEEQYNYGGKFKGILKDMEVSIRDIEGIERGTMSPIDFDNLPDWEG